MTTFPSATEDYKGVRVPRQLRAVIPYMLDLELVRERLSLLGQQWDLLTILGQVCGTGTDMTTTREEFNALTHELIGNLGLETLDKFSEMLLFKAQVAIDIVVRNLFERTADIGFLATDGDVLTFVEESAGNPDAVARRQVALRERFVEYVAKYSVYQDIVLFDADGLVLCRLDEAPAPSACSNTFVQDALRTSAPYVEYFGPCDIYPNQGDKLLYCYRVNDSTGRAAAVLCLTFAFENELRVVFDNLIHRQDWTVLGLLDAQGRVIASSDLLQMPRGTSLPEVSIEEPRILRMGGRAYLARACSTKGYQGYTGLGWRGCALLPLEHAFNATGPTNTFTPARLIKTIAHNQELFSQSLREVADKADRVQAELDRTVWNGHLPQKDSEAVSNLTARKVLLREVSATGSRTKQVFETAVGNLYQTIVSSVLTDAGYAAALAIDIMDRNLYERANDCRWWAVTPAFRRLLSSGRLTPEGSAELRRILGQINKLYTVYTSLFLFDSSGRVVASSTETSIDTLTSEEARRVLALKTTQDYVVSPFTPSDWYGGKHTYIYAAAVRDEGGRRAVGGIGVVFDSEPQFRQMLLDALPRDDSGNVLPGCHAVFVERSGRVIACSDDTYVAGATIDVPAVFLGLPNGASHREIVQTPSGLYAVGGECSHGYREYKSASDAYRNDVVSLVFLRLSEATEVGEDETLAAEPFVYPKRLPQEPAIEVATFRVGGLWLALPAADVVEAVPLSPVTAIPSSSDAVQGISRYRNTSVLVVDARHCLATSPTPRGPGSNIVIVRVDETFVGLMVDQLGEVPNVPRRAIEPANLAFGLESAYLEGVIKPDAATSKSGLVLLLRTREFVELVIGSRLPDEVQSALRELAHSERSQAAE